MRKDALKRIERNLAEQKIFSVDTNVLVDIIQSGEYSMLARILNSENYVFTESNAKELVGLCYGNVFNAEQARQAREFVNQCRTKGRFVKVNTDRIKRELEKIACLIPRKIVIDILINDEDSFVKNLIKKYEFFLSMIKEGREKEIDYAKLSREYNQSKDGLYTRCAQRFLSLLKLKLKKIELNEKAKNSILNEIRKIVNTIIREIESIISSEMTADKKPLVFLERLRLKLIEYSAKKYNEDINFVAQTIEKGADFVTNDSDVESLMALYSASAH